MSNSLLSIEGKYYLYDGDKSVEERGLTIGGYESAWLADLAIAFILDNVDQSLFEQTDYFGIYRDDGIAIYNNIKSQTDIQKWLQAFQNEVNRIAGNEFLQFTAEVWKPNGEKIPKLDNKVQTNTDTFFPFLDMQLTWNEANGLSFGVHLKPNQELKYLNKGSAHTLGCFKAITNGVCHRLTKLTSISDVTAEKTLNELYPAHFKVLE
jgi:hypothetical protein